MITVHFWSEGVEINPRLCALVRSLKESIPSRRPIGWTGPTTLFANQETHGLRGFIASLLPGRALAGWANVLNIGDVLDWHDHIYGSNVMSGVYYPQSAGGTLEFADGQQFRPEESALILFPSHLKHRVIADREHVSIAFNARS